jgi:hypothetical protein
MEPVRASHLYKSIIDGRRTDSMKIFVLMAGGIGVLVGMAFVMPAVALMRDTGALPTVSVGLLLLGLGLTIGGGGAVVYEARRMRG